MFLRLLPLHRLLFRSCSDSHLPRKKKEALLEVNQELTPTDHEPFGAETRACVTWSEDMYAKLLCTVYPVGMNKKTFCASTSGVDPRRDSLRTAQLASSDTARSSETDSPSL